jgi:hypothetical protein
MGWFSRPGTEIFQLTQRIKQLEEVVAALEDKHERLRGRFYATRPTLRDDDDRRPETKAEILKRFGYIGGRSPPKGNPNGSV